LDSFFPIFITIFVSQSSLEKQSFGTIDARITAVDLDAIPQNLRAAAGEQLLVQLHAEGVQIYLCDVGPDEKKAWLLKMPEAALFDDRGREIGRHFAGPAWRHNDGSQIIGKIVARTASPASDAIPWLLLTVIDRSGSGILGRVTTIQRLNTCGGKAPSTVEDSTRAGDELRVSYSADYLFYAPKNK
jgi:hypothetical protein